MQSLDYSLDYYSIIGVSDDATKEEIRNAYRIKARECHPDFGGNSEEMKLLNEAYQVLINPEIRKVYDHTRSVDNKRAQLFPSILSPDITSEKSRLLKDIRWLVTRAAICFLLGFICFGYSEEPRYMPRADFAWLLRILSIVFFILGVLLSYSAHKTNRYQMNRKGSPYKSVSLKAYKFLFLTMVIAFVALLILEPYLKW